MRRVVVVIAVLAMGCSSPGQVEIDVPLFVVGTRASDPVDVAGGRQVELDRADLAFGPLYLCAGDQAGQLCETARLEWLDAVVVDALDDTPARAGTLRGVTGTVRSFMYDLGLASLLTRAEPLVLPAADELGAVSLRLEGRVIDPATGAEVGFAAALPIAQGEGTEQGVPVVRKSASEHFDHEVGTDESGLLLRFDATAWIASVDFEPIVSAGESCATDCAGPVDVDAETATGRGIRNAIVAGARPRFQWRFSR